MGHLEHADLAGAIVAGELEGDDDASDDLGSSSGLRVARGGDLEPGRRPVVAALGDRSDAEDRGAVRVGIGHRLFRIEVGDEAPMGRGELGHPELLVAADARERGLDRVAAEIDARLGAIELPERPGALPALGMGPRRVEREEAFVLTMAIPHRLDSRGWRPRRRAAGRPEGSGEAEATRVLLGHGFSGKRRDARRAGERQA